MLLHVVFLCFATSCWADYVEYLRVRLENFVSTVLWLQLPDQC